MPTALDQALTELDGVEFGFVLGALLAGAVDEPTFAATLPVRSRERCEQALAAIAVLPRADRVRLTGLLARAARAVSPAGIGSVHPDHLRAVLDDESLAVVRRLQSSWDDGTPAAVRAAVVAWVAAQDDTDEDDQDDRPEPSSAPTPVPNEADAELLADVQRSVFAGLAEVPRPWQGAAPLRWSRRMTLMDPAALLSLITEDDAAPDAGATPPRLPAAPETLRLRAHALGARLAREDAGSLGAPAQALALAQRLPRTLAEALLEGAREAP